VGPPPGEPLYHVTRVNIRSLRAEVLFGLGQQQYDIIGRSIDDEDVLLFQQRAGFIPSHHDQEMSAGPGSPEAEGPRRVEGAVIG
jgi:hypothetical protein